MELTSIFEVVRIKQEIKESTEPFALYAIRSPEDAQKLAMAHIAVEHREVFSIQKIR